MPGGGSDVIPLDDGRGAAVPLGEAVPDGEIVGVVAEGDGVGVVAEGDGVGVVTEGDGVGVVTEGDGVGVVAEGDAGALEVVSPWIDGGDVCPLTATTSLRRRFLGWSADCVWDTADVSRY
jgi:hypothetical protein